jgi:inner membrane protein
VLVLATISILTHPTLDWMNSYGLRWLMPFDGTWFYGDSLFIVDPYLLLILGAGVLLSRKRDWPARIAVGIAGAYIVAMLGFQNFAENRVRQDLATSGRAVQKLVVTASPANPFRWRVYADDGAAYWKGNFDVPAKALWMDSTSLTKGLNNPAVVSAMKSPDARAFLDWARLPFFRVEQRAGTTFVRMTDARYGASITVPIRPLPSQPQ